MSHNQKMMSDFDFGIVTPIWNTNYLYLKEMVHSVNRLYRLGIPFKWSIVIDGDKRDVDVLLKQNIDPLLWPYCIITTFYEHRGPSIARNIGVEALDCEYVCWLDADDAIDSRNFFLLINTLTSKGKSYWDNYGLIFTDSYDCDSFLRIISVRKKKFIHSLHSKYKNTSLDPLLGVDFIYQMQFIKRKTFLSMGGFDERLMLGEDLDLILRISEISRKVNFFHIPIPVYYYRNNPNGTCNSRWEELKHKMEVLYLESSKRQNLSLRRFRFTGVFGLYENIFHHIEDKYYFSHKSPYDIYLPIDEGDCIMCRSYIEM